MVALSLWLQAPVQPVALPTEPPMLQDCPAVASAHSVVLLPIETTILSRAELTKALHQLWSHKDIHACRYEQEQPPRVRTQYDAMCSLSWELYMHEALNMSTPHFYSIQKDMVQQFGGWRVPMSRMHRKSGAEF